MTFENSTVQCTEFLTDSTQFSPILLPKFSYSRTSKTRKDNKRLPTGKMIVNNQGKVCGYSGEFISIWKLPEYIVTARCERQVFRFIAEQLEDPHSFLINVRNVHEKMELEVKDQAMLRDGRSLLYQAKYQCLGEKIVGRIWKFREIISN